MVPWLWIWSPQSHFPWSGSVAQHIEPKTNWFNDYIKSESGDAQIEESVFQRFSYGTQLSQIIKFLLATVDASALNSDAKEAYEKLLKLHNGVNEIKDQVRKNRTEDIIKAVIELKETSEDEYESLLIALKKLIAEG
ncbi:hypothetical protein [Sessilibacter sp. MAH4]